VFPVSRFPSIVFGCTVVSIANLQLAMGRSSASHGVCGVRCECYDLWWYLFELATAFQELKYIICMYVSCYDSFFSCGDQPSPKLTFVLSSKPKKCIILLYIL
jgi:hypothetical protein